MDGYTFDSQAEFHYYQGLKLLLLSGNISHLEVHPKFPIVVNDVKIGNYYADFRYMENGAQVIDDIKGVRTPVYKLKKKLVEALHGIKIREIEV
jgi:hypothetical protein